MFEVKRFTDIIQILPCDFNKDKVSVLSSCINNKLANKVIKNIGLCIGLHSITKIGESIIIPGDGSAHTKVAFNFVIFRPFLDEVLIGKVKYCSQEGVYVTMGFFDDILIPAMHLPQPSRFDAAENVWIWSFENEGETHELFMDKGEPIKFKVIAEVFNDIPPESNAEKNESPYFIKGSVSKAGFGLLSWWAGT